MWFGNRMKSIIVLLLVTAAHGAQPPFENNHYGISFYDQLSLIRPVFENSEHWKWFEKYTQWLKNHKPQRNGNEMQTDVIYDPAKKYYSRNRQLGYPSYFTMNHDFLPYDYENQGGTKIIPNWTDRPNQFENSNSVPSTSIKIKRKEPATDLYFGTNFAPLYLDITINQSNGNEQKHINNAYQSKMKHVTEKNIKDCFDLHAILNSRKEEIKIRLEDILSERNKMYNNLPNSDLVVTTSNKCNELKNIVVESLTDFKRKLMLSNTLYVKDKNDKKLLEAIKTTERYDFHDQTKSQVSDYSVNKFESKTKQNIETSGVEGPVIELNPPMIRDKEVILKINTTFANDSFQQPHINDSGNNTIFNSFYEKITLLPNFKLNIPSTTPVVNLKKETIILDVEKTTILDVLSDSFITSELVPTTPTVIFNEITNNSSDVVKNNVNKRLTTATDNAVPITTLNTHIENVTEKHILAEHENITISTGSKHDLDTFETRKNNTNLNNMTDARPNNANNRSQYSELTTPNLDTTDPLNENILSELSEYERISNFNNEDLADDVNLSTTCETSTISDRWDKNIVISNNSSTQREIILKRKDEMQNIIHDINADISGKLFFKFGSDYILTRFVQKPDGQVNVALDILSLCKSNKMNEFKLIKSICRCIKFK